MSSYYQINPSWAEYLRTYQTYKAMRIAAGDEWDRFENEVDSQYKLDTLRAYIHAIWRELHHRRNWNPAWGDGDQGHRDFEENLDTLRAELEIKEASLSHRIDTERYEMEDDDTCGPGTSRNHTRRRR